MKFGEKDAAAKEWLRPEEVATYSGIARTRVYKLLADGSIRSAKLGRTRHVRRRDVDEFLESKIPRERRVDADNSTRIA